MPKALQNSYRNKTRTRHSKRTLLHPRTRMQSLSTGIRTPVGQSLHPDQHSRPKRLPVTAFLRQCLPTRYPLQRVHLLSSTSASISTAAAQPPRHLTTTTRVSPPTDDFLGAHRGRSVWTKALCHQQRISTQTMRIGQHLRRYMRCMTTCPTIKNLWSNLG